MTRRKKNLSIAEQLEALREEIATREAQLKNMKKQEKELIDKKQKEELERLYKVIKENGMTVEEIEELISAK